MTTGNARHWYALLNKLNKEWEDRRKFAAGFSLGITAGTAITNVVWIVVRSILAR